MEWDSAVFSEARSHIARRTSCSGIPAAAATWTKTSGETVGVPLSSRDQRRAFSSAARRRIISTSAGLRRLVGSSAMWGVILQVLEALIPLRGNREYPRRVPEIGPAGEQGQQHRDQHRPPAYLRHYPAPSGGPRVPEQQDKDGDALGVHLRFAPAVSGDDLACLQGNHPQPRHGELPDHHDGRHPGRHRALAHEREEDRDDERLVRDGVHELAETRNLARAPGDDPVKVVGEDGPDVDCERGPLGPLERQVERDHQRDHRDDPDQRQLVCEGQAQFSRPLPRTDLRPAITLSPRLDSLPRSAANVAPFPPRLKARAYRSEVPRIWVTAGLRNRPTIQSAATRTLLCGLLRRTR